MVESPQIAAWTEALQQEDSVLRTLYDIFRSNFDFTTSDVQILIDGLKDTAATQYNPVTKYLAYQVFYKILFHTGRFEEGDTLCRTSPTHRYGMLHSNTAYHMRYSAAALQDWCLADLENMDHLSVANCQHLVYSLDSMLEVIKLYGYNPAMSKRLWRVVQLHLETPIGRVRGLVLDIFGWVAGDRDYLADLIDSIRHNYTWLDHNRYELLAIVVKISPGAVAVSPDVFFEGLAFCLRFRKLALASQSLVRELKKQPSSNERLIHTAIEVFKNGSDLEVKNLKMAWSSILDLDAIASNLGLATMTIDDLLNSPAFEFLRKQNFQKLIILRSGFQAFAVGDHTKIDEIVVANGTEHPNFYVRELVCCSLADRLMGREVDPLDLENFEKFLAVNVHAENSSLRSVVVIKMRQLLVHLKRKNRKNEVKRLCRVFRDGGFEEYQETIARLMILQVFLDVTGGLTGLVGFLDLTPDGKEDFYKWLDDLIPKCLTNNYDDVRSIMLALCVNRFLKEKEQFLKALTPIELRTRCLQQLRLPDPDSAVRSEHFASMLRLQNVEGCEKLWTALLDLLESDTVEAFRQDPLRCAASGRHYFSIFACFDKLLDVTDHDRCELLSRLCNRTAKEMLHLLNAGERPTFERINQNLKDMVAMSKAKSDDPWHDEQTLLKAIWLTLKVCCKLSLNFLRSNVDPYGQIRLHKAVLLGCCHKGVIEAAGDTLGSIVQHVTAYQREAEFAAFIKSELIDEIVGTSTENYLELRSTRGLCIMLHQVARHDMSTKRELFYYCLTKLLPVAGTSSKNITILAGDDLTRFHTNCQPLQLTVLTSLVKDGGLAVQMLPFLGIALQLAFEMFKSPSWGMRNSAAQLFAATCSKLAKQKLCFEGADDAELTPISITYCEIFAKFPDLWTYIVANAGQDRTLDVMLLKFLSMFEYRDIGRGDNAKYLALYDQIQARDYRNNQITKQLRRFEANLTVANDLPLKIEGYLRTFFGASGDCNHKIGLLDGVVYCLQRCEANNRHRDKTELFVPFRVTCRQYSLDGFVAAPYWLQLKLLDTLLYLGFAAQDAKIWKFITADRIRTGLPFEFGHDAWLTKLAELQTTEDS